LFTYDPATSSGTTIQITDNIYNDNDPQVSGSSVVWQGYDAGMGGDVLEIRADVPDPSDEGTSFAVSDGTEVVPGDGTDVVFFEFDVDGDGNPASSRVVIDISAATTSGDVAAAVAGAINAQPAFDVTAVASGDRITLTAASGATVDFVQGDSSLSLFSDRADWDIFRYDIPTDGTENISSNACLADAHPQIHGNRIVWESVDNGDVGRIMYYDLRSDAPVQPVASVEGMDERLPLVSESLVVWRRFDGTNYELMVAQISEPSISETLTLTVYGDTEVEPNEWFRLNLTDAHISDLNVDITETLQNTFATVEILNDDQGMDFGDAPAPYPTVLIDGGAFHALPQPGPAQVYLGSTLDLNPIDPESDGQPDPDALGDDSDLLGDDEEEVSWTRLEPGKFAEFTVDVTNASPGDAYLSAWLDLNSDGVWGDDSGYTDPDGAPISEKIISEAVFAGSSGTVTRTFRIYVPAELDPTITFARFRLSSDEDDVMLPTGPASDGEVEDYAVEIEVGDATISGWKFDDRNADGLWNAQGLPMFVPSIDFEPFGAGDLVVMSGRDSDGQIYGDVGPNDDLSSDSQDFGFAFEFYGNTYTRYFINNNGNISFEEELFAFSPDGFPQSVPVVAPFWADVDTRDDSAGNPGGEVRTASGTSSRGNPFVQIDWVDVGYFDRGDVDNNDARNSFTLYIEDDPVNGDIVVFDYTGMEWTTGDVSGTDGFGGLGAQIGFDAGDGANFLSLMRPNDAESLSDLLQVEQYTFRIDPATGTPVNPEPGLAGVTMFIDVNGNRQLDLGYNLAAGQLPEPWAVTMEDDLSTTDVDETGYYEFDRLFASQTASEYYVVRELSAGADWIQTYPNAKTYLPVGSARIQTVGASHPNLTDAKWFQVGDGVDTVTFEFNLGGTTDPLNVPIPVGPGHTAALVAANVAAAVNSVGRLDVTAVAVGDFVYLTADNAGEIVTFNEGATPSPMTNLTAFSNVTPRLDGTDEGFYEVFLDAGEHFDSANFGDFRKPQVSVTGVFVGEGDIGETPVEVEVHVTKSFGATVEVDYYTQDGTAHDGNPLGEDLDYRGVDSTDPGNSPFVIGPHNMPTGVWDSEVIVTTEPKSIVGSAKADIVFLFDISGSMTDDIVNTKQNLLQMEQVMLANSIDARYGLVTLPSGVDSGTSYFDQEVLLVQDLTDFSTFTAPGSPFSIMDIYFWGVDEMGSRAVLEGLNQILPGTTATFRPDATTAFILITDEGDDSDPADFAAAQAAIAADNAVFTLIGADPGQPLWYRNTDTTYEVMAAASGGGVFRIDAFRSDPTGFFDTFSQFIAGTIVQEPVPEDYFDVSGRFAVWEAKGGQDGDIFMYDDDTGAVRRLTNNDTEDYAPRIDVTGDWLSVVWVGHDGDFGPGGIGDDSQIFLYRENLVTGVSETLQLTHNPFLVDDPQVSDTLVTWWGETSTDREIYVYDIAAGTTTNVSAMAYDHAGLDDFDPHVAGDRVVWYGSDGKDDEIYFYDAATGAVTEVTSNAVQDGWARIGSDTIAWKGWDGTDYEIFVYDFVADAITQLTWNGEDDDSPQVNESGENVVWQGYDDSRGVRGDVDIFRYHVPSGGITNVSANAYINDSNPRISGDHVVWESERLGGNWEVMHYELGSEVIPQNVSDDPANEDRYPVVSDELVVWRSYDGQVYRLMVGKQAEPEITAMLPLVVYGDTKVEPDETFLVNLQDPNVVELDVTIADATIEPGKGSATVTIVNDDSGMDFGDAPAAYRVVLADDGARHALPQAGLPQVYLGSLVDPEQDGQPDSDALGDDNDILGDDDDGVVVVGRVSPGEYATFQVEVVGDGYLSAWIDFNRDGVWDDYTDTAGNVISERVISAAPVSDDISSFHTFDVMIPADLNAMTTFARFRFSSDAGAVMLPTGLAPDGEVEDYRINVEVGDASISGWKFNDWDGDGVWDDEPASSGVAPVVDLVPAGVGVLMTGYDSDGIYYPNQGTNDNLSAGPYSFGFNLEFYGSSYSQFFINNNGNITLSGPSANLPAAGGFPQAQPRIAPFWADVDTRNSAGSVHLATGISPRGNSYVQVDWAEVGYNDRTSPANQNSRNSFALYIEDDPGGDIVVFHYYDDDSDGVVDMDWAVGDSGGGANGYGVDIDADGIPDSDGAEIGFDAGNFNTFYSLARPQTQADLENLNEQYGFRFDPTTGRPLGIEPGLPGVAVYVETDGTPGLDPNTEAWTVTMEDDPLTVGVDETGYYSFDRLFDGFYEVHEVLQPDWVQTAPNDTAYLAGGSMDIQVSDWSDFADRQTFTISDGDQTVVFELDNNVAVGTLGAVPVSYVAGDSADTMARAIANAVNAAASSTGLGVSAAWIGDVVTLNGTALSFDPGTTYPSAFSINASETKLGLRLDGTVEGYYDVVLRPAEQLQGVNFGNYKQPHVRVSDVAIAEGNAGITYVDVTVHVTESFGATVKLDYETSDGDATLLDSDYNSASGSVYITPHGTPLEVWTTETITRNRSNDYDYHVSGDSVVWEGHDGNDWEVYLYDAATDMVEQLTNNDTDDKLASHYKDMATGRIYVVWSGVPGPYDPLDSDYEIYFYDSFAGSATRLTDNAYDDKTPQVSESHVVWWADMPTDSEIFLYDIAVGGLNSAQNISSNGFSDYDAQISGANVAWYGDDGTDLEVYLYRAVPGDPSLGSRTQLTNNVLPDHAVQIDGANVVWQGYDGVDDEIFVYQFDTTSGTGVTYQVTNNTSDDIDPHISGENIVWQGLIGTNREIFYTNIRNAGAGLAALNISNNGLRDEHPRVAGNQAVWHTWDGTDWEVYHYEFGQDKIPVNLSANGVQDWYPELSEEMLAWRVFDGQDYEVVVAMQSEPEVTATITLEINGDLVAEPDQSFFLTITGATVEELGLDIIGNVDDPVSEVEILNDDGDLGLDYGDAPASYATLLADNGARHQLKLALLLGASVDDEGDGLPGLAATGDDADVADDEDGIVFYGDLGPGNPAFVEVTTTNVTGGPGYLSGWIDFNGDGDFADAGEQLVLESDAGSGLALPIDAGSDVSTDVSFLVPTNARLGDTYARFRFSSSDDLSYTGSAEDGEVEDYLVTATAVTAGSIVQSGTRVTVVGTDANDVFRFTASAPDGDYVIFINGETYSFPAADVGYVSFSGGAGTDTVLLQGTSGDETAKLWPDRAIVKGDGFAVAVSGSEFVTADGGGGDDLAQIFDDPDGMDTLRATPNYAKLSGDGFAIRARSFRYVHTYSTEGNGDLALLYDDPATQDWFKVTATDGRLYGDDFFNRVVSFRYVHAYATPGGGDVAMINDEPGSQDTLQAWPDRAKLFGDDFFYHAKDFNYVHAYATPGDGDVALLYDDPTTQDWLKAWPNDTRLYSDEFFLRAKDFGYVHAYATKGNGDVALLYGDPDVQDTLKSWPDQAKLYGDGYFNRAKDFGYVHAYATPGGNDVALMYDDPGGSDTFSAWSDQAKLTGSGYFSRAKDFRYVHAYSTAGDNDVANLYGDDASQDTFEAWPTQARITSSDRYSRAVSFGTVNAYGTPGGDDTAYLYDSALDEYPDYLEAADNWARVSNDLLGYAYLATDFETVEANASNESDVKDVDPDAIDFLLMDENW